MAQALIRKGAGLHIEGERGDEREEKGGRGGEVKGKKEEGEGEEGGGEDGEGRREGRNQFNAISS